MEPQNKTDTIGHKPQGGKIWDRQDGNSESGRLVIGGPEDLDPQLNDHQVTSDQKTEEKSAEKPVIKETEKPPQASFVDLFFFVEGKEKILLWLAIIFSVAQGLCLPIITILLGDLTNSVATTGNPQAAEDNIRTQFQNTIFIGLGVLGAAFIASMLWNVLSAIQTKKIKMLYFKKLLEQNSAWYDKARIDLLSANFIDQVSSFTAVFSTKMHLIFMNYATFVGGLGIGFIKGWLLTLFILLLTPIMFFGMFFFIKAVQKSEETQRTSYAEAGSTTDECFTFIKTVKSLNGEEHEIKRYTGHCEHSKNISIKFGYKAGLLWGIFFFSVLFLYAMAYLIGSRLIANNWINDNFHRVYNIGDCLTIFFAVITGIFSLGNIGPLQKALEAAKVAIAMILKIIREDQEEKSGDYVPPALKGRIDFEHVSFSYPSNPEVPVLKDVNFTILPGQSVAFVGPSGSGKSTVVQLIERFYDPTEGRILLDGVDLRKYDLTYLRQSIGLVSQQPILFAESIKYNILLGLDKTEEMQDETIWTALREAMADEFVRKFNHQLEEFVGSQGGQLSGGQKQRIAIARALIRRPAIFLFDEATSALDRKNELEIQKTLEQIAQNKTTLTVAHRLTTIRNSDCLFVLQNGVLVEQGTHDYLMRDPQGIYHKLVEHQIDETNENNEEGDGNAMDNIREQEDAMVAAFQSPANQQLDTGKQSLENSMSLNALPAMKLQSQNSHQVSGDPRFNSQRQVSADLERTASELTKRDKLTLSKLVGPERKFIVMGVLVALGNGAVMPIFGYLLGLIVERMGYLDFFKTGLPAPDPTLTQEQIVKDIDLIVGGMVIVAFGSFVCSFLQWALFNHVGELFTFTIRTRYFRRLMYKDLEYFDKEENQPGSVSSRLALDCKTINILIGTYIGSIFQSLSSLMVGVIIGLIFSWRIALVMLALVPLIFVSGFVDTQMMNGKSAKNNTIEGSDVLPETLNNMKVVRSLTAAKVILARFERLSESHRIRSLKLSWIGSFAFGFSQFSMFLIYAVVFRVGAKFQVDYGLQPKEFFIAIFAIIFGGYGAGMANQFMGGIGEAKLAAAKILDELNSRSFIESDPLDPDINAFNGKLKNLKPDVIGTIEFRNVDFAYQGRKNKVLNHLNFRIPSNQTSAFVGGSGSGKSTIMQMLLRFYDPQKGAVLIDGIDIRDFDITHLRSIFGIVRQEPTLFNGTIEYNVKYNNSGISEEQVRQACESANALDFIYGTPESFQRDVGNRGEKMSGGQKQRIAIARILVRNPKILLFDEATSALDSNSEAIVQNALEAISKDRASISIAHRISTIKSSDTIFVLEGGKVIEKGTYTELMNKKGRFTELAQN